jgi:hypothetical protein
VKQATAYDLMKKTVRFANQLRALWKLCLSYRKRDWDLSDYPVVFRTQISDHASAYDNPRFKLHQYVATIVNWHLTGCGDTREEALRELRSNFVAFKSKKKESGKPLPRPGTRVPIEFAPQDRVNANPELAQDFIRRVLELDWAWISDESSLWDFNGDETNDALNAKIREFYDVDVSDIKSARLCEIFERISAASKSV